MNTQETKTETAPEQAPALTMKAYWSKPFREEYKLNLGLQNPQEWVGGIEGELTVAGPYTGQMTIHHIEVFSDEDKGKGIGKKLLQSFAAESKRAGATTLVGEIVSKEEIHNRMQTFGEDNVQFYEDAPAYAGDSRIALPLTREQALLSLQRAHQVRDSATIMALTDLTKVDTSEWELPTLNDYSEKHFPGNELIAHQVGAVAAERTLEQ